MKRSDTNTLIMPRWAPRPHRRRHARPPAAGTRDQRCAKPPPCSPRRAANSRRQCAGHGRLQGQRRLRRPPDAERGAGGSHGAWAGGGRRPARPAGPILRRMDPAERAGHLPRTAAAWRAGHDLREPPQCGGGCRRNRHQIRQRHHPARRVGELPFGQGHQRRADRGAYAPPGCPSTPCRWRPARTAASSPPCCRPRGCWTSSSPAAARRWWSWYRKRRACPCWRMPRG